MELDERANLFLLHEQNNYCYDENRIAKGGPKLIIAGDIGRYRGLGHNRFLRESTEFGFRVFYNYSELKATNTP
jgi:hypothetical protein